MNENLQWLSNHLFPDNTCKGASPSGTTLRKNKSKGQSMPFIAALVLLLLWAPFTYAFQKTYTLTGKITTDQGAPLPGATVKIKDASSGTNTDAQGQFSIKVSENDVLVFSAVGYKPKELAVNGKTSINVQLELHVRDLGEVVVIGYGTQQVNNVSSALSSVKGDKLEKVASTNPINALQGRVAGLSVSSPGGNPGQVSDVRLRGVGTMGMHQPLYVIDGVPGDPYYLSSGDVASIVVLKDGAAASIYGSVSANGVILITTKKGKKGQPVIDFNSYYGVTNPTKKYSFLDADGYKTVHRMMYDNAGEPLPDYVTKNTGVNTNWQDLISKRGMTSNYNLNMKGGSDYLTYSLSGDLTDEGGTFIGSKFNKKSVRSRNDFNKGILSVESNILYSEVKNEGFKFDLHDAYYQSPLLPVYDSKEKYGYGLVVNDLPKFQNPIGTDHFIQAQSKTQYFSGNIKFGVKIVKGLKYTANLSYISGNTFNYTYSPPFQANANDSPVSYTKVYNYTLNNKERLMEHLLNYDLDVDKHSFKIMGGYTAQDKTNEWLSATAEGKTIVRTVVNGAIVETEVPAGFLNPDFNTITAGMGGTISSTGSRDKYVRLSTLARFNYAYDDKYLFQASVRRDGSSLFGENKRYGVFPSVSVGWNIEKESFMKNVDWLDNLKLRASYGELGNEGPLKNYDHQTLIKTVNMWGGGYVQGSGATPWPGSVSYSMPNPDLRWETIKSTNIGIDFGLFNHKLTGSINYFNNKTNDLLITKELAPSGGFDDQVMNVGKISNKGLEFEANYQFGTKELRFDLGGTFSLLSNKVLQLANDNQVLYGTGLRFGTDYFPTQTKVGRELGAFYLYQAAGIFQSDAEAANYKNSKGQPLQPDAKAGDIKFLDTNGDGVIDEKDKTYQGSGFPKYEFSINLAVNYKNFDFSMFWQGVAGNKIFNGNRFELEGMEAGRNFLTTTLNAWTPQNTNTDMPRAVLSDPNGNARESSRFLENGAYLRLKNIQIGYTLPQRLCQFIKVSRIRAYISAQNIVTITQYKGLDPEVGNYGVLDTGVDRMMYPQNKKWLAGIQLSF